MSESPPKLTVAELKRRVRPGVTLALVRAYWFKPDQEPIVRQVVRTDTVNIVFAPHAFSKGQESHLGWPKAAKLVATDRGFIIKDNGDSPEDRFDLEYEWVDVS